MMKGLLLVAALALAAAVTLSAFQHALPLWLIVPAGAGAVFFAILFVLIQRAYVPLRLPMRMLITAGSFALVGMGMFALLFTAFEQSLPWTMVLTAVLALGTAASYEEQPT